MQPHNELRLPLSQRDVWPELLRLSGIDAEVDPKAQYRGRRTKVEVHAVRLTKDRVSSNAWELVEIVSESVDYFSLIYVSSVDQEQEALNELVVRLLVEDGAITGIYDYPERR